MHLKLYVTAGLLFGCALLSAQRMREHSLQAEPRNKGKAILAHVLFGTHRPAGDLADRFGPANSIGLGSDWIAANNLLFGLEGQYYFGNKVQEDPLAILRTPEGDLIGNDQLMASVPLRQRGWYMGGLVGKLFTVKDLRSGVRVTFSAGVTQHKIRVQDDGNTLTQITGDYAKGYDRLTGGLALQQFVGWQQLAKNRRANWMIGFEFNQGFTHTLRDWDFTERRKLDGQRVDLRFGIRAAWTIPFYIGGSEEIYY